MINKEIESRIADMQIQIAQEGIANMKAVKEARLLGLRESNVISQNLTFFSPFSR